MQASIKRQVAAIREYCDQRGIVVTRIVTANGQSGMRPFDSRGGLLAKEVIVNDTIIDCADINKNSYINNFCN